MGEPLEVPEKPGEQKSIKTVGIKFYILKISNQM